MDSIDLRTRLHEGERLLLDGGVGTELARLGLEQRPGVIHGPQVTRSVHERYLGAGIDLLTTDTFTTNRYALRKCGHPEERMAECTRCAVEIAREARDRMNPRALVAGSMSGPGFENIEQEYADQTEALVAGGVEVLLPEYTSFVNCAPAVRAASRSGLPVFLGVRHVTDKGLLDTGHTIQEVIDSLDDLPDAVLLMCSPPEAISASLPLLRKVFDGAIGAYANILHRWNELTPERYAEFGREWVGDCGAQIIGGCCGTRPEHIAALRRVLDEGATPG